MSNLAKLHSDMKKLNNLLENNNNNDIDKINRYNKKVSEGLTNERREYNIKNNILKELGLKYGFGRYIHRGSNTIQSGGDKAAHGYCNIYFDHLKHLKEKKINFLEIGIFQGRSLAMWNDFFENGNIYGIDINLTEFNLYKKELKKMNGFLKKDVIVGEANTKEKVIFNDVKFDVILDDGCHKIESQIKTFQNYYPLLKKGGYYIIEDLRGGGRHEKKLEEFFKDYNRIFYLERNVIIFQK